MAKATGPTRIIPRSTSRKKYRLGCLCVVLCHPVRPVVLSDNAKACDWRPALALLGAALGPGDGIVGRGGLRPIVSSTPLGGRIVGGLEPALDHKRAGWIGPLLGAKRRSAGYELATKEVSFTPPMKRAEAHDPDHFLAEAEAKRDSIGFEQLGPSSINTRWFFVAAITASS